MKRVKFELSMPNVGSWNGKWTGSSRNYFKVYRWPEHKVREFFVGKERKSWYYDFRDGWGANVSATIVPVGTKLPKSDGFCNYDWMVDSILSCGEIHPPKRN